MLEAQIVNAAKIAEAFGKHRQTRFAYSKGALVDDSLLEPVTISHTLFSPDLKAASEKTIISEELCIIDANGNPVRFGIAKCESIIPIRSELLQPFTFIDALNIADVLGKDTRSNAKICSKEEYEKVYLRQVANRQDRLERLVGLGAPISTIETAEALIKSTVPEYPVGHERFTISRIVAPNVSLVIELNGLIPGRHPDISIHEQLPTLPDFPDYGLKTPAVRVQLIPSFEEHAFDNRPTSEVLKTHLLSSKGKRDEVIGRVLPLYAENYPIALQAVLGLSDIEVGSRIPKITFSCI